MGTIQSWLYFYWYLIWIIRVIFTSMYWRLQGSERSWETCFVVEPRSNHSWMSSVLYVVRNDRIHQFISMISKSNAIHLYLGSGHYLPGVPGDHGRVVEYFRVLHSNPALLKCLHSNFAPPQICLHSNSATPLYWTAPLILRIKTTTPL